MKRKVIVSLGMFFLTIAYCWLIWLGFGLYSILLPPEAGANLPLITRLTAFHNLPFPYHALPWQVLAAISLVLNISWLFRKKSYAPNTQMNAAMPLACHTGWIVFSICCHGSGMLAPYISFASVLSS